MEPAPPPPGGDGRSYGDLLAEVARLAGQLESGAMPLEEALDAYAEGVRLLRACEGRLRVLEERARVLSAGAEGWRLDPLEDAPGSGPAPAPEEGGGGDGDGEEDGER